jgi:GBP family porin
MTFGMPSQSSRTKRVLARLYCNTTITPQARLMASFIESRATFVGSSVTGVVNQINLGVDYSLSRRTDVYVLGIGQKTSRMYTPGITGGNAPGADALQFALVAGVRHFF